MQLALVDALGSLVAELGGGSPLYVQEGTDLHVLSGAISALAQRGLLDVGGGSFWPQARGARVVIDELFGDWLRPYQLRLAAEGLEAFMGRGILKAPTGSGKTRILTAIIVAGRRAGIRKWVVSAPNKELLRQLSETLVPRIGRGIEDVYCATMTELACRRGKIVADGYLTDECHRIGARTYALGASRVSACWRLGLSATPLDRGEQNALVVGLLGPVVAEVKREELVDAGFLSPGVVKRVLL